MFKSVKEQLIANKNSNIKESTSQISKYILSRIDKSEIPKSKEIADACFVSESVVTAFSKKMGYSGYRELSLRIKVENEYYNINENMRVDLTNENEVSLIRFYDDFLNDIKMIHLQDLEIKKLIDAIKIVKHTYIISCYQQAFSTSVFAEQLQLKEYEIGFNISRKANTAWVRKSTSEDIAICIIFGVDNEYLVNFYNRIKQNGTRMFVICSPSQKSKLTEYDGLIEVRTTGLFDNHETSRSALINYLFNTIIINV